MTLCFVPGQTIELDATDVDVTMDLRTGRPSGVVWLDTSGRRWHAAIDRSGALGVLAEYSGRPVATRGRRRASA